MKSRPHIRWRAVWLLILPILFGIVSQGRAEPVRDEWVWDAREGWISLEQPPADSARGWYRYARALMLHGDVAAACEGFQFVEDRAPETGLAARARFRRAECLARLGRYVEAFELSNSLLQGTEATPNQADVIRAQLSLLEDFTHEDPAQAAEMLGQVASRELTTDLSYRTHMLIGEARYRCRNYTMASQAYAQAAETDVEEVKRVQAHYMAGVAALTASREESHEPDLLESAQKHLKEVVLSGRDMVKAEKAQQLMWAMERLHAEEDPGRRHVYYAVTYIAEARCDDALPILKRGARTFEGTRAGETARFFQAQCLQNQGELWSAFKTYERFLDEYPSSMRQREAVRAEFQIGHALRYAGELYRAVRVFEEVVVHLPSGPLADDAEMQIGLVQMERGRYQDARAAFDVVVAEYPQSEWYYPAVYYGGRADLIESDYRSDNEELVARARRSFEAYLERQPDGRLSKEAARLIEVCRNRQAMSVLQVARFYLRQDEPNAAAIYCRSVVAQFPDTASATEAESLLEAMRLSEPGAQ